MNNLFDVVEPLATTELLANYWHFLKAINEKERAVLGPIEIVLKSRTVARGWPIGLKNQTLALISEAELSTKSVVVFVDITEVSSVSFHNVHNILPFVTAGALSRSPLERRATHHEAKQMLLQICEDIRKTWPTRIYFETDPTTHSIDELTNLNEVMSATFKALRSFEENPLIWSELLESKGLHVLNALDMKNIAFSRRESGDIEIAFRFSRALPKSLDDKVLSLFSAVF